jgi:hypothetical protein
MYLCAVWSGYACSVLLDFSKKQNITLAVQ